MPDYDSIARRCIAAWNRQLGPDGEPGPIVGSDTVVTDPTGRISTVLRFLDEPAH